MTTEELHAQDVAAGLLQTVQAGGRVHVVKPDPAIVGRWQTIATLPNMALASAFIDGYTRQAH